MSEGTSCSSVLELKVEQLSEKVDKLDRIVHMQGTNIMLRLERLEQQMSEMIEFREMHSTMGQQVDMLWREVNIMWNNICDIDKTKVIKKK